MRLVLEELIAQWGMGLGGWIVTAGVLVLVLLLGIEALLGVAMRVRVG